MSLSVLENGDARTVHAVIANHAAEGPNQHLGFGFRLNVQDVAEVDALLPHVAVLPDQNLAVGCPLPADDVGRASLRRRLP